ncbi:hypothetical protein CAPTEDRAFT_227496 [Capitella teleta]|uniref:THUMP domain-containing protein n=1 Tax=Capitella teleta TaxID=283909 RepID=R7UHU8_CAPTE|nr:hypothetical protein CAPTEDRAFT_227496 [Capitella teleta]|eukprot:ELU06109.1 hypothetical protein CAPTEDRAFT_227496 [Capitella teleta]
MVCSRMGSGPENKMSSTKRKKGHYIKASKGKKARHGYSKLDYGMTGFLITCNRYERETINEAYNLFNEYADVMYGPEKSEEDNSDGSDCDGEQDIEKALAAELASLKKEKSKTRKRFQVVESGANNCIFIRTTVEKPDEMLHKIFSDIHDSQKSRSRYMMRVTPTLGTCRADSEKLSALAGELMGKYFNKDCTKTYCIMYKARNNVSVNRHMAYKAVGEAIEGNAPLMRVSFDDPDVAITVDIIKTVCCVGIVKDFVKFRKYNIQEVARIDEKKAEKAAAKEALASEVKSNEESKDAPMMDSVKSDDAPMMDSVKSDDAPMMDSVKSDDAPIIDSVKSDDAPIIDSVNSDDAPIIGSVKSDDPPIIDSVNSDDAPIIGSVKSDNAPNIGSVKSEDAPIIDSVNSDDAPRTQSDNGPFVVMVKDSVMTSHGGPSMDSNLDPDISKSGSNSDDASNAE